MLTTQEQPDQAPGAGETSTAETPTLREKQVEQTEVKATQEAMEFLSLIESFLLGTHSLGDVLGITEQEVDTMAEFGDRLLAADQAEQARAVYEGCLTLNPVDPTLHARLATCADVLGQADQRDLYAEALMELVEQDERDEYQGFLAELSRDSCTHVHSEPVTAP